MSWKWKWCDNYVNCLCRLEKRKIPLWIAKRDTKTWIPWEFVCEETQRVSIWMTFHHRPAKAPSALTVLHSSYSASRRRSRRRDNSERKKGKCHHIRPISDHNSICKVDIPINSISFLHTFKTRTIDQFQNFSLRLPFYFYMKEKSDKRI